MKRRFIVSVAGGLFAALTLAPAFATGPGRLPNCVELATHPSYGLVGHRDLSALSSALVPAAGANAAYCQVDITVSSESGPRHGYLTGQSEQIRVRVGLPLSAADGGTGGVRGAWNGKQRDLGGGGYAGSVGGVTGSTNIGYVGTSTDTGHTGGSGSFALNPDNTLNWGLIEDFAKDGIHAQLVWGTRIAKIYYGKSPTRRYWTGCSTGGRQGHQHAQSFPKDYDGILAGAPAFNWDRFIPSELWPQIVMRQEVGGPIASAKLTAVSNAAIAACDALDGVPDGILQEPRRCDYDARSFVCTGGPSDPANCLTMAEAVAVNKIWNGPVNARGEKIWFGLERGTPLAPFGLAGAVPFGIAVDHFRYWIKQDPTFDWQTVTEASFVNDFALSQKLFNKAIGTDDPDLSDFRRGGGKMIMYHGLFDTLIFPRGSYDYYNRAAEEMRKKKGKRSSAAGMAELQEFYRYFPYPNVGHCAGGTGPQPNTNDLFNALVDWVENGVAPEHFVATQNLGGGATRTRKICKYPDVLVYDGSGNPNDHNSFRCARRALDDRDLLRADRLGKAGGHGHDDDDDDDDDDDGGRKHR
jgi:Tannase and feruloyl esterase